MEKLYTEKEVAEHFRVSVRAVQRWRADGKGPAFVTVGKNTVRYRAEDLAAYNDERTVIPRQARRAMTRAASAFEALLGRQNLPQATRATIAGLRDELRALTTETA